MRRSSSARRWFDSRRRRLLVFGGAYGLRDTWALSLDDPTHWTLLDPGYAPVSRSGEAAVIVPQRDRMYLFGGRTADGGTVFLDEIGELSPAPVLDSGALD